MFFVGERRFGVVDGPRLPSVWNVFVLAVQQRMIEPCERKGPFVNYLRIRCLWYSVYYHPAADDGVGSAGRATGF